MNTRADLRDYYRILFGIIIRSTLIEIARQLYVLYLIEIARQLGEAPPVSFAFRGSRIQPRERTRGAGGEG